MVNSKLKSSKKATTKVTVKKAGKTSASKKAGTPKKVAVERKITVVEPGNVEKPVVKAETTKQAPKTQKKDKKGLIIGLIALILVILAGIGVIFGVTTGALFGKHEDETTDVSEEGGDTDQAVDGSIDEPEPEEPQKGESLGLAREGKQCALRAKQPVEENPRPSGNGGGGSYQVAANRPRYMSIPALGVYNALILEMGLLPSGELQVPVSPYHIGWYTGSRVPGTSGVALMEGHGGDLGVGILKNLPRRAIGAEIIIEMGDGRRLTYVVADKAYRNIGADADNYMSTALTSPQTGVPSITIITCTGEWIRSQQTYTQRMFLRATLRN